MANIIKTKSSDIPSRVPKRLAHGELAVNIPDGKLYVGNANGDSVLLNTGKIPPSPTSIADAYVLEIQTNGIPVIASPYVIKEPSFTDYKEWISTHTGQFPLFVVIKGVTYIAFEYDETHIKAYHFNETTIQSIVSITFGALNTQFNIRAAKATFVEKSLGTEAVAEEQDRAMKAEAQLGRLIKNISTLFVLEIPESLQLDTDILERWKTFATEHPQGTVIVSYDQCSVLSTEYDIRAIYGSVYDSLGGNGLLSRQFTINDNGKIDITEQSEFPILDIEKGQPNGIASLDRFGKVPVSQIPTPEGGYLRPLYEAMPNVKWNPQTKMYDVWKEYGGISVTEKEMVNIYNYSLGIDAGEKVSLICYGARAIIPRSLESTNRTLIVNFFQSSNCELLALTKSSTLTAVINNFFVASKLKTIYGNVYCSSSRPYKNLIVIENIDLVIDKKASFSIDISDSPVINYKSLRFIPDNVKGTTYSNVTTITLHQTPYSLLTGTATSEQYTASGHTKEEWIQIVTDSTAKGITFTKAL